MSAVSNAVYCFLSPGKPDPREPRLEGTDSRRRVLQSPQKGKTCWYYGLKLIREQFGKDPHPNFFEERRLEKIASVRRKQKTELDGIYRVHLSYANQFATDPNYTSKKINTLMGARNYLTSISAARHNASETVRQEAHRVFEALEPFCKQSKFTDLHQFLREVNTIKCNLMNTKFLDELGFDPKLLYIKDYPDLKPWSEMTDSEKGPYLDSFAFQASYQICYKLSESPWHPSQPISSLISALESCGPHYVKGLFGKAFYKSAPLAMKDKVQGRTAWYWPTGAERIEDNKSHSVVIVGAREGGTSGGYVYFVDPLDGSDPSNPEQQRIYVMSYKRLCESIINLKHQILIRPSDGTQVLSNTVNYALYKSQK